MESQENFSQECSESRTTILRKQEQFSIEPDTSYVVLFPHTTESLSVYSLLNAPTYDAPLTLQRRCVPQK
jgi:hypothetical protein